MHAGNNPDRRAWSDVLVFAVINALYDAAAANAAASVGRAYVDTATRLALLLSPVVRWLGGPPVGGGGGLAPGGQGKRPLLGAKLYSFAPNNPYSHDGI
jgi:hypothetical protein